MMRQRDLKKNDKNMETQCPYRKKSSNDNK